MRRQGRNRRQEPLPDKGMGVGDDHLYVSFKNATRRDPRAAMRLRLAMMRCRYFGDRTSRAMACDACQTVLKTAGLVL